MTSRRHFLRSLAAATAGFTILPPATTYDRVWKATRMPSIRCDLWRPSLYSGEWRWVNVTDNDRALQILEQRFIEHLATPVCTYLLPVETAPFPHGAGEVR